MKNLFLILLTLLCFEASAQIHDSIRAKYSVKHDQVGKLKRKFEKSLKKMELVHPGRYYEISLEQSQAGNMNEASVAAYLGMMKYLVYNQTNPDYQASGDGAANSALLTIAFQPIIDFLSSNLNNHAFVLKKAIDLQANDKKYFFTPTISDSISSEIVKSLREFQQELELYPDSYIAQHENLTNYDLDLEELYIDMPLEEEFEEEKQEVSEKLPDDPNRKKSGDHPFSFLQIDKRYIVKGEPTKLWLVAHGYGDTYVECSNCKIYPKENPLTYELISDTVGICSVLIYGVGPTRKASLGRFYFQVLEKPDVYLFVGKTISGRTLEGKDYKLTCDELNYFRFEDYTSKYTVQSWEIWINNNKLNGNGDTLSATAIELIEKAASEDVLLIKTKVVGPKGEEFSMKGVFLR